MLTVNGVVYKDVNGQDFNHYFSNTAMAWKISPTKRRLFLVSQLDASNIKGTYLTRDKEFKNKELSFVNWWESLDAITMQPIMFNLIGGVGLWYHKTNKNLKKSFPWIVNQVTFFGNVEPKHKTMQIVAHAAFQELYGLKSIFPTLLQAMVLTEHASVTKEGFIVDKVGKQLWYKTQLVGAIEDGIFQIPKSKGALTGLLKAHGVGANKMLIIPDPPVADEIGPIPMKYNKKFMEGYHPQAFPGRGYSVVRYTGVGQHEYRTYSGFYPGPALLMPGWGTHNYWGQ